MILPLSRRRLRLAALTQSPQDGPFRVNTLRVSNTSVLNLLRSRHFYDATQYQLTTVAIVPCPARWINHHPSAAPQKWTELNTIYALGDST